ncbi:MAG: hypothetical protein QHH05_04835, partial [Syntrophomonadaceae bacterium]|nr:hypothetical protein [Syntrophomonadaceae bacterium]
TGAGLQGPLRLVVHGVPGNDTACYLDGPEVIIHGNAQDGVGNTMNRGRVVVHGRAGDVLGYGMRGGEILVRDSVGYRVGIHMKEYGRQVPLILIGTNAGAFLGEYMAGGRIVVLALDTADGEQVGPHCGSGLHGGAIFIRGGIDRSCISPDVEVSEPDEEDRQFLERCVAEYDQTFGRNAASDPRPFVKLVARKSRPYARLYVGV